MRRCRSIHRRLAHAFALAPALMLTCAIACTRGTVQPPAPTPLVIVTIDTLRADHVGTYGYFRDTTPVFDRIAADGVVFRNAVTTMATTLPAHTSLMTSTYPARHGVLSNFAFYEVPVTTEPGLRTVAQMLNVAGYRTAAFVSTMALGFETGIASGFDVFRQPDRLEERAATTVDRAVEWLAGQPDGRFFLWVHLFDPHNPYQPPTQYEHAFAPDDRLRAQVRRRGVPQELFGIAVDATNRYDCEIRYADAELGRLVDVLVEHNWYEPAAVVVTSDHGEGLLQHGHAFHGVLYNEQLDIPLVIKFPRGHGPVGGRVDTLTSIIDVLPTIAAATDLPIDSRNLDGVNALEAGRLDALAERERTSRRFGDEISYALRTPRWKYVFYSQHDDALFDLEHDYGETRNVLAEHPDRAVELKARLLELVDDARSRVPEIAVSDAISDEQRDALRSLGYTD